MNKKDIVKKAVKKKTTTAKIVIAAVGVGLLTFVGVKVVRAIKSNKLKKEHEELLKEDTDNAVEYLTGRKLTDSSAKNIAEQLYVAMDGMGTDESTIKRLLIDENPTSADIIAINNFFGIHEYGSWGSPVFGSGEQLDLRGWLKKEISSSSTLYSLLSTKFNTAGLKM